MKSIARYLTFRGEKKKKRKKTLLRIKWWTPREWGISVRKGQSLITACAATLAGGGSVTVVFTEMQEQQEHSVRKSKPSPSSERGDSLHSDRCALLTNPLGAALFVSFLLHKMALLIGRRLKHGQTIGKEEEESTIAVLMWACHCFFSSWGTLVGSVALTVLFPWIPKMLSQTLVLQQKGKKMLQEKLLYKLRHPVYSAEGSWSSPKAKNKHEPNGRYLNHSWFFCKEALLWY